MTDKPPKQLHNMEETTKQPRPSEQYQEIKKRLDDITNGIDMKKGKIQFIAFTMERMDEKNVKSDLFARVPDAEGFSEALAHAMRTFPDFKNVIRQAFILYTTSIIEVLDQGDEQ